MLDFKRGEGRAFEELFGRYKNAIYGYIRRRVGDPGRAEEITQDVFLALVRQRNGYEVESTFRTYLYRIAMNRVVSEYRRTKENDPLPDALPASGGDPSVQQVREALAARARGSAKSLPCASTSLSYDEIAGCSTSPSAPSARACFAPRWRSEICWPRAGRSARSREGKGHGEARRGTGRTASLPGR
jgi:RNA polymerase sigma factor (sigma-70 family)